jgi:hypothetical protein
MPRNGFTRSELSTNINVIRIANIRKPLLPLWGMSLCYMPLIIDCQTFKLKIWNNYYSMIQKFS